VDRKEVHPLYQQPSARSQRINHTPDRGLRIRQMLQYPTCVHEVEFADRQVINNNVVFQRLEVGFAKFLEKSWVNVGAHDAPIRSDLSRQPTRDRSGPAADFETMPPFAQSQTGEAPMCYWIEILLQQREPSSCIVPGVA